MASINQVSLEFSTKGERQAIQALKNLNLSTEKLRTSQVSASQAAARLDAQRKKETRELERLRGKYIQGHAAMEMYSREMNDLARARRANIISAEQQTAEVARLNQVMQDGTITTNNFAGAQRFSGRNVSKAGVLTQQAGYQVGDFIVQVQSGTNWMVAFGQQATQIAGTLTMMGGKFILLGSVLGVAIPLATALGAALMRTRDSAEDSASDIASSFSDLEGLFDDLSVEITNSFDTAFDQIETRYGEMFSRLAELRVDKLKSSLSSAFEESVPAEVAPGFMEKLGAAIAPGMTASSAEALSQTREMNDELYEQSNAVSAIQKTYLEKLESAKSVQRVVELTRTTENELAAVSREAADAFIKIAEEAGIFDHIIENTTESLQRQVTHQMQIATIQKEVNAGVDDILETRDAELKRLQDQTRINNLILKHGEDSKEVVEARLALAREQYKLDQEDEGLKGNNLKLAMEAYDAYVESKSAVEGIADASGNIDFSDAVASAKALAETLGIAVTAAASLQNMRSGKVYSGRGGDPRKVGDDDYTNEFGYTNVDELIKQLTPSSGGSGGGSARSSVDETDKLRESVSKLIASYDEEYAIKLKIEEATKLIAEAQRNDAIPANMEADQVLQDYIASLRDVEDPMMKIAQTARDELGDALMSIVDGTASAEDAFKNMARAILKQAFDLLVIKPLMDSLFGSSGGSGGSLINGLLGQADGGAWNKGVQMYANGGVVDSPTGFQHKGGLGVMGEAGPEAIMPLKRGKGGKLGVVAESGQGDVRVENHFHIAANGDDSVKRIIQQEAPKIANYTSQKIMEQRQRGGAMKQTFR